MSYESSFETKSYAALKAGEPLVPHTITRRGCTDNDVVIKIAYAGICHSDIHSARDEWSSAFGPGNFPLVPGHEIVGTVVKVGKNVKGFQEGDLAGVGCMVDSCRQCACCKVGDENYCSNFPVYTYGGRFRFPHCAEYTPEGGNFTHGGYSQHIVVDQAYTLLVPSNLDLSKVAPLLCAGITTYSPLVYHGLKAGQKLGVAGLGGLGHMAVKFGVAMGAHVTVLSRGTGKRHSAINELGAHAYCDTTNPEDLKANTGSFDIIINTIAAPHEPNLYLSLLGHSGKMVMVGAPPDNLPFSTFGLIMGRKTITGSAIGGIRETQDMLNFCGKNNITSDVELIRADQINEAYERTLKSDVKYRFVIDINTL